MARPASRRARIALALAGVLILTFVLGVGVFIGSHLKSGSPSSNPSQPTVAQAASAPTTSNSPAPPTRSALADDFAKLQATLRGRVGLAVAPAGNGDSPLSFGAWETGPAWSTIKVPLAIAAYREDGEVTNDMRAAITESDNAAAESVWAGLGAPVVAAHKVDEVLRETGDKDTVVQSEKVRPEYTAFGQTDWPLTEQARFLAVAACDNRNVPILDLMGEVEPSQSWGIGTISGTRFKGGWGPSTSGSYLVRQIGILTTEPGVVAVAIAAQPDSGSFDEGVAEINAVANWLSEHSAELPAGRCSG
ncbi:MAG: hypothetical protein ACM4D3_05105 [Candidatus Sericytochromatia bacterium]